MKLLILELYFNAVGCSMGKASFSFCYSPLGMLKCKNGQLFLRLKLR
ncbi:hypothetical protein GPLA_2155 [Paraglaciecola polaris LMG 21857]|uniref:Uncharacterized protein n=1 Tax=Paraglaciecola polaris LMG 21857 TaxID=1129793 RepID=K7ACH8_9ALTE|nr:hypothetical protein GPLA_2155 [Paraglaciecola polaris LMG 21857]